MFKEMPKKTPKTVMMHTPLFIDNPDETDSEKGNLGFSTCKLSKRPTVLDGKTIPLGRRQTLLDLFCENGVNLIYSGHTHMTTRPDPVDCGTHLLEQLVVTSVNAQLDWQSESKYYPKGTPQYVVVTVDGTSTIKIVDI